MRLQKKDGSIVETNALRAKQLIAEGATVVNPQSGFERTPAARKALKAKTKKMVAAQKKAAKAATKPADEKPDEDTKEAEEE